uniref:SAP domain-containing protein n=1 Tax=viral metagenome TaxID=1070528 RepID=A0A6C0DJN3_9ZZZZ
MSNNQFNIQLILSNLINDVNAITIPNTTESMMNELSIIDMSINNILKQYENNNNSKTNESNTKSKKTKCKSLELSEYNYANKEIPIKEYKLDELKKAAKKYKLLISGNKTALINRLQMHFKQIKNAIILQKNYRRWIVNATYALRGPAFKNRKLCVNDTDFVTMEPLDEIPNENFFSYMDTKQFIYGFNITSIIQMIRSKGKFNNPYNREELDKKTLKDIKKLYRLCFIVYPDFKNENESVRTSQNNMNNNNIENGNNNNSLNRHYTNEFRHHNDLITNRYSNLIHGIKEKLRIIREKTIEQRITELFIEFDHLGNYTNRNWFSTLDSTQYIRLYRCILDIWNSRGQLSYSVKSKICLLGSPFTEIIPRTFFTNDSISYERIQNGCLTIFENLVYTGIDEEHRKLGAFHALTSLTVVSRDARQAMPWLYESVVF